MKQLSRCLMIGCGLWLGSVVTGRAQTYQPYTFTTIAGSPANRFPKDGVGTEAGFGQLGGLAVDNIGRIFVADLETGGIKMLAMAGTNWIVSTIATNENVYFATDVAADTLGNLFVAGGYSEIQEITPAGTNWIVSAVAGNPDGLTGSADGTNSQARFYNPTGIAVDGSGNLFVADGANFTIRKVTPVGTNWVVTTIAGMAGMAGSNDGTNGDARFFYPGGITVDRAGNLYVRDNGSLIRKLTPVGTNWVVTTIAGHTQPGTNGFLIGGYADGVGTNALFDAPGGLVLDGSGNLYVCDSGNQVIRKLTPLGTNWVVTTLAGRLPELGINDRYQMSPGEYADGTGTNAQFYSPGGMALGPQGRLYITDRANYVIRMGEYIPALHCSTSGNQLVLSWSALATGFALETKATLDPGASWILATNAVANCGNSYVATNEMTDVPAVFRLRK